MHLLDKDFPGIVIAEEPEWKDCIQGSSAVVNLAGMPISTRWSSEVCYNHFKLPSLCFSTFHILSPLQGSCIKGLFLQWV